MRDTGKDLRNLQLALWGANDKPILYISKIHGDKYIVPKKIYEEQEKVLNELLMLINDLEPTFNRKGMVSMNDDNLGTFIKDYFIDNASDLLKIYLNKDKKDKSE